MLTVSLRVASSANSPVLELEHGPGVESGLGKFARLGLQQVVRRKARSLRSWLSALRARSPDVNIPEC